MTPQTDPRYVSERLIAYTTPVGAAEVNAGAIKPYRARWTSPGGVFEETLVSADDKNWTHTQIMYQLNGEDAVKVGTENPNLVAKGFAFTWLGARTSYRVAKIAF